MKDEKFAEYNPNMFGGDNISHASSLQAAEFESTMRTAQATNAGMLINDDFFQRKLSDGAAEINPTMRAAEATEAGMSINRDYFQEKFAEITGSQVAKSDSQFMAADIDNGMRRKM